MPAIMMKKLLFLGLTFIIASAASDPDFVLHLVTGGAGWTSTCGSYCWDHSPYRVTNSPDFVFAVSINAFDEGFGDSYAIFAGTSGYIQYYIGPSARKKLTSFALKGGPADFARAIKDFTVSGSTDGSTWSVLSTITGETGWIANETRTYTPSVITAGYNYFKLAWTDNNGDITWSQLGEIYLYGTDVITSNSQTAIF